MVTEPVSGVKADHGRLTIHEVLFDGDPEDAFVLEFYSCGTSLCAKLGRPKWALITVAAIVLLSAPRVSDLDHFCPIGQLLRFENDIRVAELQATVVALSYLRQDWRIKED